MAIRIAIDLNMFATIAQKPTTLSEMAEKTKANPDLVKRILRVLTAIGLFQQKEVNKWEATPMTHALTIPPIRDIMIAHFDKRMDTYAQYPEWLRKHDYKCSWQDDKDNIFYQIHGAGAWEFYEQNPEASKIFDSGMSIQESFPPERKAGYPFPEDLADIKKDAEAVTLVDVGGGAGQAIKSMKAAYPGLPGRFILQDLPKTIQGLDAAAAKQAGFEATEHDFFKPQPVKGAKYYHLRRVLHDWNDEKSLEILNALRPAMDPAYSRLLIQDFVLADVSPGPFETQIDIMMMMVCDGKERSESEFAALLGKAGFKIDKILRAEVGDTATIVASVA